MSFLSWKTGNVQFAMPIRQLSGLWSVCLTAIATLVDPRNAFSRPYNEKLESFNGFLYHTAMIINSPDQV